MHVYAHTHIILPRNKRRDSDANSGFVVLAHSAGAWRTRSRETKQGSASSCATDPNQSSRTRTAALTHANRSVTRRDLNPKP